MGFGDWLRSFICLKKVKKGGIIRAREPINGANSEQVAAIRIQTAFRAYMARKAFKRVKRIRRFNVLIQGHPVKNQTASTLGHLHSWCDIQSQIRARRLCMVTEGRVKQRKMENQMKLEAKLNELEVEWCGGSDTMEEILSKIQQREEASVKRERAMAYAFSHQWRANASQYVGQTFFNLGKENWGWSWKERWIAARPWEVRVQSPGNNNNNKKKGNGNKGSRLEKQMKDTASVKSTESNGKIAVPKPRKVAPADG